MANRRSKMRAAMDFLDAMPAEQIEGTDTYDVVVNKEKVEVIRRSVRIEMTVTLKLPPVEPE